MSVCTSDTVECSACRIGLVMGLDSLLGMMRAMSNSLGDVTASLIVAKSEKKLDMEKYMS